MMTDRDECIIRAQKLALDLIKVLEREQTGVRDGNGYWRGSDPIDGLFTDLAGELNMLAGYPWHKIGPRPLNGDPGNDKAMLLDHYARCEPQPFIQMDGWRDRDPGDIISPDKDGDSVCSSRTWELRRSPPELAVRVFIASGTDAETAARLLNKIRDWVVRDPDHIGLARPPTPGNVDPFDDDGIPF